MYRAGGAAPEVARLVSELAPGESFVQDRPLALPVAEVQAHCVPQHTDVVHHRLVLTEGDDEPVRDPSTPMPQRHALRSFRPGPRSTAACRS